jgi:hypothetical protein
VKKQATKKRTTKRAATDQILADAMARWRRVVPRDPAGTVVVEITSQPVNETAKQTAIRLHRRLVHFEWVSRRLLANPKLEPWRRWLPTCGGRTMTPETPTHTRRTKP